MRRRVGYRSIFLVAVLQLAALILTIPAGYAKPESRVSSGSDTQPAVGDNLQLCDNCPAFVRVPDAPASLRPVQFVSKFELTWKNYLAAYDDQACDLPALANMAGEQSLQAIRENIDLFRIDWPVTQLGPKKLQCYIEWLQKKTSYIVALPTGNEWEWLARGGRKDARYPWGDAPTGDDEALFGVDDMFVRMPKRPVPDEKGGEFIDGIEVGRSSPNAWGLYDLMGNVQELTTDKISGEAWYKSHPDPSANERVRSFSRTLVKGSDARNKDWSDVSISDKRYAVVVDGRYISPVGSRLILIEGAE